MPDVEFCFAYITYTEGDWSTTTASFTMQNTVPTNNYSNCSSAQKGSSSPSGLVCGTPVFSTVKAADSGISKLYRVQISATTSFATPLWDSGSVGMPISTVASGARTSDVAYRGLPLTFDGSTYYWRIKLWNGVNEGAWSSTSPFSMANLHTLQNLSYSYDVNGNLTRVSNSSNTSDAISVQYGYDDLDRLTSASSTAVASGSNYSHTFAYDSLGNITNKSDKGSYTYTGTGYANPHAATGIAGITYTYDRNGNVASSTAGLANLWNYKNQLTYSANGLTTTTYAYDHSGSRVKFSNGTIMTRYPSDIYSVTGATSTKQVLANGQLVATIEGTGANASVMYDYTDHLSGTNVVADANGQIVEGINYYPYGEIRLDDKVGMFDQKKKYAGSVFDTDTGLNYMNARYQDSRVGRFMSQDPVFWQLSSVLLADPQQLNSYSYARNNPIIYKDPLGLYNIKTGAVEKGDTLSQIRGLINGLNGTSYSVSQLAKLNNISNPDRIYIGQTIKPNNSVPDITRSLGNVNQQHGTQVQGPVVAGSGISNSTAPVIGGIGTIEFANKFKPGGDWDLKSQSAESGVFCQQQACGGQRAESYVFNAEEIPGDAPGNIHYGYVGKRAGYSESALLFFGGVVQTLSHPGQFGDPASDKAFIRQGYGLNY